MPSFFPDDHLQLPSFKSLLVKGPYHPSAPLYLALSQSTQSEDAPAVLLSSSSRKLNLSLRQYNDGWFTDNLGHGGISAVSSQVQIFYPPTPAHFIFLLSTLHVVGSTVIDADVAHPKTVLGSVPSMIILHELSSYFLKDDEPQPNSEKWTVSSYLTLVTQAASFVSFLSSQNASHAISLALFDSRIDELKLPVLKAPEPSHLLYHRVEYKTESEDVTSLVQHYFEWAAHFHEEFPTADTRSMQVKLYKHSFSEMIVAHRWREARVPRRNGVGWRTEFVWEN
ncbi:hypothetical protein Moror_17696 [Moniliophthora roreri MCA 2997]|uniref:Uncharacterized protein n=2 Tax=Moniliophthora roreri TaxID=221103 RepID=V2XUR3_MONRO|nr:hypothetical protein Moror_17696 [Moniliophthora roreri MCA 2997]KAI3596688.1 hypothetical protein WG66_016329 [Moniliophthora roreri]